MLAYKSTSRLIGAFQISHKDIVFIVRVHTEGTLSPCTVYVTQSTPVLSVEKVQKADCGNSINSMYVDCYYVRDVMFLQALCRVKSMVNSAMRLRAVVVCIVSTLQNTLQFSASATLAV